MQIKQSGSKPINDLLKICLLFLSFSPVAAISQTTYLPQGAEENILIERMEIKMQRDSILNFSKTKPFSRKAIIPVIQNYFERYSDLSIPDTTGVTSYPNQAKLSRTDLYNMRRALINNLEWLKGDLSPFRSKRPWGRTCYQTPCTL